MAGALKEIALRVTRVAVFVILPWPSESASSVQFNLWRPLSGWSRARSTSATRTRSSVPLRICARRKWLPDRDREPRSAHPSQVDHHAGGPAQTANGVFPTRFRERRRADLLRARPCCSIRASSELCGPHPRATSLPTFRCRRRPRTSSSSTSRPPRRSASSCPLRCSRALTR